MPRTPAVHALQRRSPHTFAFISLVAALGLLPACAAPNDPWFRSAQPRAHGTVFSPLDLPTPTERRLASGAPGPAYWQQQADYVIEASLDPDTRRVVGAGTLTYHNRSPHALEHLWLHLEQNVFRSDSIGAAVGPTGAVGMRRAEGDGVTITELALASADGSAGQPLELAVFDTLGRVDLPVALLPGSTLTLRMAWEFTVPEKVFRRFGLERVEQGSIFQVAQWVPVAAVYDDVHGWNTLPYAGSGEFYTNFGNWDVKLTLPREHIVVATGVLQNQGEVYTQAQVERLEAARTSTETVVIRSAEDVGAPDSRPAGEGPLTWHFRAEQVRTFAFAASEAFILDAASLDGSAESTLLMSAYPREALPLWSNSTQMLRKCMLGFNERWYPYPWPVMINVNGIEGGMEYPMIIFCRARTSEEGLYGVTAHEVAHSWFPMLVNSDERRHAWMDEGLGSFITHYSHADWFGNRAPTRRRADPAGIATFMRQPEMLPIATPPDRLPRRLLGGLQYSKTAAGLVLLREQLLGPERFDAAFRAYIRRWAFKSPQPADFFRTMEDVAGADLAWFWRGWFLETATLDQAVLEVTQPSTAWRNHRPAQLPRIDFVTRGGLVMPLVYSVTYEDGSKETHRLPVEIWSHSRKFSQTLPTEKRIVSVLIDPDEAFPDTDRSNNVWELSPLR